MKRAAAALAWDGARVSARGLPVRARAFLGPVTAAPRLAKMLAEGGPVELRICWVPLLQGGPKVLAPPFDAPEGKRIAFRTVRTVAFGRVLGVVYRRV